MRCAKATISGASGGHALEPFGATRARLGHDTTEDVAHEGTGEFGAATGQRLQHQSFTGFPGCEAVQGRLLSPRPRRIDEDAPIMGIEGGRLFAVEVELQVPGYTHQGARRQPDLKERGRTCRQPNEESPAARWTRASARIPF